MIYLFKTENCSEEHDAGVQKLKKVQKTANSKEEQHTESTPERYYPVIFKQNVI